MPMHRKRTAGTLEARSALVIRRDGAAGIGTSRGALMFTFADVSKKAAFVTFLFCCCLFYPMSRFILELTHRMYNKGSKRQEGREREAQTSGGIET